MFIYENICGNEKADYALSCDGGGAYLYLRRRRGYNANSDRKLPIYCVETDKKQVAISFDAAWGNSKKVHKIRLL